VDEKIIQPSFQGAIDEGGTCGRRFVRRFACFTV